MGKAEFAINDIAAALVNAGVLEVEALKGGGARLVPAIKPQRPSLFGTAIWKRVVKQ